MSMIEIPENVHKIILEKQLEWYKIEGKKTNISEIAAKAITEGINLIKIGNKF